MNVYEFEKSLLTRLEESSNVLQCKDMPVPASEALSEWAYHIELQIEPAGWQALWKISRVTCEDLGVKYPTVVFGTVTNVFFKELKAEFEVIAVQDEDVHIPEMHIIPLEDLWPTKHQENSALNVDRTADCIDQLRFFCRNVWMPWDSDNDDDLDWAEKHLESRIRFCFDLKRGMSRPMADRIRILLNEARYIQSRRNLIETSIAENDDDEDFNETPNQSQLTDLMRFHLRLAVIRNEIDMLENPDMRKIYEEINFPKESGFLTEKRSSNSYIVVKDDTISNQINYLEAAKSFIGNDEVVKIISSLKDCFRVCSSSDKTYVPLGRHMIKFLEPLNSNGLLKAIVDKQKIITSVESLEKRIGEEPNLKKDAIIVSEEDDSALLVFNGDYVIENIVLDCRNVRLGLWCRSGHITLKNCVLIGNKKSSTGNGVVVAGGALLNLENTLVEQFATGITCSNGKISMKNSIISHCNVGLNFNESSVIRSTSSKISNCFEHGVVFEASDLSSTQKKTVLQDSVELIKLLGDNQRSSQFAGECDFESNKKGNILIFNHERNTDLNNSVFIEDSDEPRLDSSVNIKARDVNMDTDTSK